MTSDDTVTAPGRNSAGRFARTPENAERDAEAARLYARGRTQRTIAAQLGYSDSGAVSRAIQRVIQETERPAADEVREMMLAQLDELAEAAFAVLEANHLVVAEGRVVHETDPETGEKHSLSDPAPVLKAIDTILKIHERRAKYTGLDAPVKSRVEVVGPETVDDAIAELEKRLAENDPAAPVES